MPKATRDRLLGVQPAGPPPQQGTLRVRMPEGLLLQVQLDACQPHMQHRIGRAVH